MMSPNMARVIASLCRAFTDLGVSKHLNAPQYADAVKRVGWLLTKAAFACLHIWDTDTCVTALHALRDFLLRCRRRTAR